jgi:nucleotide-binding universal stress UspA family protein
MKTFDIKKILIPVDLSENSLLALEHGTFLAKLFKADISLTHIVVPSGVFGMKDHPIDPEVEKHLHQLAEEIRIKHGCKVEVIIKHGKISNKVVEAAKESNTDIIILGTHGVSGFEEFFMGSNAFRVITQSPCPVISVQEHAQRMGFNNILCPIDNSSPSRQKLRFAAELAKHYNSQITLLGILSVEEDELTAKFNKMFDQMEEYLTKKDIKFKSELVYGTDIASTTIKYAEKNHVDLITIMTEQEDNFGGIFLGPYAQQIVNHSKIPVMSIKPDGNGESAMNMMIG